MPHALIVDDDLSFQLGFAEAVRQEGFTTSGAGSVAEARGELAREAPDVVFFDLQLPDGTGLDLLPDLDGGPWKPSSSRARPASRRRSRPCAGGSATT